MKKRCIDPMKVFASMLFMGCALSFVACSDDDGDSPQLPDAEVTTDAMFGNYTGTMTVYRVNPLAEGDEEATEDTLGVDVSATINNDTIYLEDFPIRDIVLSIVKNDTLADQIVEAVGDVDYQIGYEPKLTANKDSITFTLNPEPLKLSVSLPSATEEAETQPMQVEVKMEAGNAAAYAVETGNVQFDFSATEILLGEGEEQTALPDFGAMSFKFDMNQK